MTALLCIALVAAVGAGFAGGFIAAAMWAAHDERPMPGPRERDFHFPASGGGHLTSRAVDGCQSSSGACASGAGKLSNP